MEGGAWDELLVAIHQRFIDKVTLRILDEDVNNRDELATKGRAYIEVYNWLKSRKGMKDDD